MCLRKRKNRISDDILTSHIVDGLVCQELICIFLAYPFLSFGMSLRGLKVSPGCTSYLNFLFTACFAATLPTRVSSAELPSLSTAPQMCVCIAATLQNLQLIADVPLSCALPCTKLTKGTPRYSWVLLAGIAGTMEMSTACTFLRQIRVPVHR